MQAKDLIGKFYPIKDIETNEIVGFKTITGTTDLDNVAGFGIYLDRSSSMLIISYKSAVDIVDNGKYQCLDKKELDNGSEL